jgi:U3 small nucleolar RNA-associated protein 3
VSSKAEVDDDIVDYLEVKQQLLLSYCLNAVFYLYMKAQGQSVRSHPVMKQLLELR